NTAAEEVPDAKRATDEGDGMRIDPASRIELVDALLNFFRSSRNTSGECLRLVHHLACVLDRTAFSRGCQGVLLQWESSIAARACPSGTLKDRRSLARPADVGPPARRVGYRNSRAATTSRSTLSRRSRSTIPSRAMSARRTTNRSRTRHSRACRPNSARSSERPWCSKRGSRTSTRRRSRSKAADSTHRVLRRWPESCTARIPGSWATCSAAAAARIRCRATQPSSRSPGSPPWRSSGCRKGSAWPCAAGPCRPQDEARAYFGGEDSVLVSVVVDLLVESADFFAFFTFLCFLL